MRGLMNSLAARSRLRGPADDEPGDLQLVRRQQLVRRDVLADDAAGRPQLGRRPLGEHRRARSRGAARRPARGGSRASARRRDRRSRSPQTISVRPSPTQLPAAAAAATVAAKCSRRLVVVLGQHPLRPTDALGDQQLGRHHGLELGQDRDASLTVAGRIRVSIHSGSQRTRPCADRRHRVDLAVVGLGVLEPALVERQVAEADRAHRPPFAAPARRAAGRPPARTPPGRPSPPRTSTSTPAASDASSGVSLLSARAIASVAGGHRRRERAAVLDDAYGAEHADQRTHRAAGAQVGVERRRAGRRTRRCGAGTRATGPAPRRGTSRRPAVRTAR